MSHRSSQRVDRRRRVLVDESRNEGSPARPRIFRGDSDDGPTCRYNAAALQAINAPIAKYIPLRPFHLLVWFLVGLIPVIGLLLLHERRAEISRAIGTDAARAFDLAANGNLAAWFSSVTFGFAVALMLGIYSVRRHRRDDYGGRFTVWRWAIACSVLVSVDATAGLHRAWQGTCQFVTETTLWGDGSIWWVGPWALLLGGMLLRLIFEMASSRKAVVWASSAVACYLWAVLVELDMAFVVDRQDARTSQTACLLLGHHLILFSLVNYAREVVLEAMGLVESPAARRAKSQSALAAKAALRSSKTAAAKIASSGGDKQQRPPVKSRAKPTAQQSNEQNVPKLRTVSADDDEQTVKTTKKCDKKGSKAAKPKLQAVHAPEEDSEEELPRTLSRAERRRLRKEQKRRKAA